MQAVMMQGSLAEVTLLEVLIYAGQQSAPQIVHVRTELGVARYVVDGERVELSHATWATPGVTAPELTFELLREVAGEISLTDAPPHEPLLNPITLPALLSTLDDIAQEWEELMADAPDSDAVVELMSEALGDVVLDQDRWLILHAVGDGLSVGELFLRLDVTELKFRRMLASALEGRLVAVGGRSGRGFMSMIDAAAPRSAPLTPPPAQLPQPIGSGR
jgi:hypothetical protein